MKLKERYIHFAYVICLWLGAISASAITFTANTYIGPNDVSSDGQDIVVTNCTLTVDGAHGFNSLQLQNGSVLTHSAFTNGPGQIIYAVNNESQTFDTNNSATLLNTNIDTNTIVVTASIDGVPYTPNVDYLVTVSNQFTQLMLTTNSAITNGATVLVSYNWSQLYLGFYLTISNDMDVTSGALVNLSGMGYAGGNGFSNGVGTTQLTNFPVVIIVGGGGGHGGCGGMGNVSNFPALGGASYDSTTSPAILGSGGGGVFNGGAYGGGGAGGGLGQLSVDGTLQVDGQILADGLATTNTNCGGGAGGGLLLSAQTFSGAGTISAQGGSGSVGAGGGGGGGIIAIYSATNTFTGYIVAFGGAGANYGGAGTILNASRTNGPGQLFIANNGIVGTNTLFLPAPPVNDLIISGGAIAQPISNFLAVSNLLIGSNSTLLPSTSGTVALNISGNATVESNAFFKADSQSLSGGGDGSSSCGSGSGGSYGGFGGVSACGSFIANSYGVYTQPVPPGSPGGGSPVARGGGAIQLTVAGTLSVSGQISANGAGGTGTNNGGGSGGSVWLIVGTLSGGGMITANGGSANNPLGGGGGGGRIAIYFNTTNSFLGPITAYGGAGANAGGAGSIYLKTNSSTIAQIIFDNNGVSGTSAGISPGNQTDIFAKGGAILSYSSTSVILRNLSLTSNCFVVGGNGYPGGAVFTASNITIPLGAGFSADSNSVMSLQPGSSLNLTGGGGGNGGCGGMSASNAAGGGSVLNSLNLFSIGSFGGNGQSGLGGHGGGAFSLNVSGTLQLDGTLSANGGTSTSVNSGGGSGGGFQLTVGTFAGAGTISANGGAANNLGGGGGGGRVAIYYLTNLFTGSITAYGGPGATYGGAGTIYEAQTATLGGSPSNQVFLVDNGGFQGTNTGFPSANISGLFDFTIRGGALVALGTTISNGNLTIGSNSALLITLANAQEVLKVATNATIQAGGAIRDDGISGLNPASTGANLNSTGGGGGNGGIGGSSSQGALGGGANMTDSFTSPVSLGAPGGRGVNTTTFGGLGGGSLRFIVNGTLQLDGIISAQGVVGTSTNSGGGSGGTIWVSAGTISGAGAISVNGGASTGPQGGGGGGGRIALNYNANSFTGNLTAYGGAGAQYGGAGTIYTGSSFQGPGTHPTFTADNGGVSGQLTIANAAPMTFPISSFQVVGGAIFSFTNVNSDFNLPVFGTLLVGSNSTLFTVFPQVTISTNATVQTGGTITTLTRFVYGPPDSGQGANTTGGGGGHGGFGGFGLQPPPSFPTVYSGGSITDSIASPTLFGGSGGPNSYGGPGGGPVHLIVGGVLQLDGVCSVDGAIGNSVGATNYGGGAGGAIWVQARELLGAGSISANGAPGTIRGGGGGGGRIAIWANTNLFSGTISARGGPGLQYGGAGTIYFNSNTNGNGSSSKLIVDNAGNSNAATAGISSLVPSGMDVALTNGGVLTVCTSGSFNWNSLNVGSNCSLNLTSNLLTLNLTVNSNAVIQPGGSISLDGEGFAGGGPGAGGSFSIYTAGGGGHGGMGSAGTNPAAHGGLSYDSITVPSLAGSSGGASTPNGSAGGGALKLTVNGLLQVDGTISANGQAGAPAQTFYAGGGGGAGGSLWLTAGTFSGAGSISANGGNGIVTNSGGGGGGRVAIYFFNSNNFTGTVLAHGGTGVAMPGGAGTIFIESNSAPVGQLFVDNGGLLGTNTPINSISQVSSLSISNGAVASSGPPLTLQSLSIGSNAFFTANSQFPLSLTVLGNAFVDTNGAITANGTGYNADAGPGSGTLDSGGNGSGGGYGGVGGNSVLGTVGGSTYGSSNQPIDLGSAGGIPGTPSGLSEGGGAIRLIVDGALTLNGIVAANGQNGTVNNSGGGSGGSIWLTAQSLAGSGSFSANGGSGATGAGSGGGGRIAIYANTNSFFGNAASSGGTGAFAGQPGTVVIATNLLISGNVTDTNGVGITGITLQPSGLAAVTTDSSGSYSFTTPLFWTGTVAPTSAGFFVPNLRNYSSIGANFANQNYLLASPGDFNINSTSFDGTNLNFSWYGINGVTYQPLYSSNLVNWLPYGPAFIGSNAPATFSLPVSTAPQLFFRLSVSY